VAESPGCVERFVCESFRTGENLDGPSYILMAVSNAAVSYTLAEQFDNVMELKGLQSAARMGRSRDSCDIIRCGFLDTELRSLRNNPIFDVFEYLLSWL